LSGRGYCGKDDSAGYGLEELDSDPDSDTEPDKTISDASDHWVMKKGEVDHEEKEGHEEKNAARHATAAFPGRCLAKAPNALHTSFAFLNFMFFFNFMVKITIGRVP